jgi:hypothetical protein
MIITSSRLRLAAAASPLALALSFVAATPANAQTETTEPTDTTAAATQETTDQAAAQEPASEDKAIVVTGFRAALASATSTKKRTDQVVEAVTAEDIGKLPDNGIGESIARLPGISAQRAQGRDLLADLGDVRRQLDVGVAALEAVFDLRPREVVQHDLHHRELVQVGVEQRLDDHPKRIVTVAVILFACAAVLRSTRIPR